MRLDPRINLLTLVRQQIDVNLQQVSDAASRFAASSDNSTLTHCVMLLHQVGGALRMVQLAGAARFASEIETAVKALLRSTPADKPEVATASRGARALRDFINDVAASGIYVPVQLFPVYRELANISGNDTVTEKDLFFPEAHDDAPTHASPRSITPSVLPALLKDLRTRYQRGLLAWLKESSNPDGLTQMRTVLDQMHQIAAQLPQPRGLWWASVTLIEGLMEVLPAAHAAEWIVRVKPVCSRIDFLLRDLAANAQANTALVQRDVYYAIASCRLTTPRLRSAQRALNLAHLLPERRQATGSEPNQQPALEDARARFENIKAVWTEYVAGEPNRLTRFRELLAPLTQRARELGNLPLLQLLLAVGGATPHLPDPYPLDGQVMSLEMAAALLMAEDIVAHFDRLPADLEAQVTIMRGWLNDAAAGKVGTSSPSGLRADIVQKANDEKLRIATAREILKSLQQVEKAVESYVGDASQLDALNTLRPHIATLRQVRGVFAVSNQKRAARLATACQHLLERCLAAPHDETASQIEWLAEGLGSLGFYLEPCLHGKEPAERAINIFFTRYEHQRGFEALLALSQSLSAAKPTPEAAAAAAPAADAQAAAPALVQAAVDREMIDVFLEEASEVLAGMEAGIAQARHRPGDHDTLINVRRAFHTLKGSARMVGLTAYGECAWEMEQAMNHWLAQALPATPELFDLCADARGLLAQWAHELQGETLPTIDASGIAQRARALRGVAPVATATAVAPAPQALPPPEVHAARELARSARLATPLAPVGSNATAEVPAAEPVAAYQQTLGDLGDRLSWLNGLVEEIQQQAAANGAAGTRLNEIAHMMGESMNEVLTLHRDLSDKLAAHNKV